MAHIFIAGTRVAVKGVRSMGDIVAIVEVVVDQLAEGIVAGRVGQAVRRN